MRSAALRRRRLIGMVAVAAAVTTAVACTKPPTSGGGGPVSADALPECPLDALEAAEGPVEVTLWYGGLGGNLGDVMEGMVERFNDSRDQVHLTASNQGESYAEVYRTYESAASADAGQLPGLIYLEDTQLRAMVDSGRVLPAQSCMEATGFDMDRIEPVVRSTYTVEEVLYPGYMNVSTPILYYNRAHWAAAGLDPDDPPGTLEELREAAVAIKEAGVAPRPFSFKLSRWLFETWLSGVGAEVVNQGNGREGQATEALLDTPQARELMAFFQQMNEDGLLNPFANTEGGIDHYLALLDQQSSMLIETSAAAGTIRDALGGTVSADEAAGEVDLGAVDLSRLLPGSAPFPGIEEPGQVRASGGAFYILNSAEPAQQAAAWRFLEFMLRAENAKDWYMTGGYLPILGSIHDEPEVQEFSRTDVAGVLLRAATGQLEQADPDRPGPLIGPYPDFGRTVEQMMEAVVLNGEGPGDALAEADATVTESLRRYAG